MFYNDIVKNVVIIKLKKRTSIEEWPLLHQ